MELLVKGVIFLDYVRMIKNRADVDWGKYLTEADKQYFNQHILDSEWYPYSTLERMSVGIITEMAKKDMEVVQAWGRMSMDRLTELNKSLVSESNPMESVMRFKVFRGSLFNFDPIKVLLVTSDSVKLELNYGMRMIAEKAAAYHTMGYVERLLQLSGVSDIAFKFHGTAWEGDSVTTLEIQWRKAGAAKRARGAVFVDYVRMIKSRSDVDWSKLLLPEDLAYLSKHINDDEWYPFDTFERMGMAIMNQLAGGDFDAVRIWGQLSVKKLIEIHKGLLRENDPMESLMRFHILRSSFFDFDPIYLLSLSPFYAQFEIHYGIRQVSEKAATYQALGYFEKLLELSEAKDVKHKFTQKAWEGAPHTILEFTWK